MSSISKRKTGALFVPSKKLILSNFRAKSWNHYFFQALNLALHFKSTTGLASKKAFCRVFAALINFVHRLEDRQKYCIILGNHGTPKNPLRGRENHFSNILKKNKDTDLLRTPKWSSVMGWFGRNFWFVPLKMVTFKIKDELVECIYFKVIYFQKK